MSLTTPKTWGGEVPTKAHFDTHISQNFLGLRPVKKLMTEDFVVNTSDVFEDIPGLFFEMRSGETWFFEASLYCVSNATADMKFTLQGPPGSAVLYGALHYSTTNVIHRSTLGLGVNIAMGANNELVRFCGLIVASGHGVAQLQAAQLAATAVDTQIFQESSLYAMRRHV